MMCKSKIQKATVTQANLNYTGSITIDSKLMDAADILPGEMVLVVNVNTGARFETYAIKGKANSGIIGLNGAAARLGEVGDQLIIISYGFFSEEEIKKLKASLIIVNSRNKITRKGSLH
ncbi:MAG: aspartate 1-decarboxylase [bacterium]